VSTGSDVVAGVLWTEKYRPTQLADLALEAETRQLLQSYIDAGEIPHLLLIGPAGSGKTTVARILGRALDASVLTLNASSERGIDTVREKIGSFVTAIMGFRWNLVFLDEADAMTADAQTALRNLIESYADRSRFILTANYGHRIINPIQSRCQVVMLGRPPLKERYRILISVLEAEGITATPQVGLSYAEKYPDLRQMLMAAQKAWLSAGKAKTLPLATHGSAITGAEMFTALTGKNWQAFRRVTTAPDFDATTALRNLFHAVPDEYERAGFLRHIIGKGVHETGFTPDPVILFLGVVAEAMEGL
jgi:ATPase family associated with various cellular activities (AAA)